ncbi:hypothetical protein LTR35_002950 [Friedmanniomyces endolithicus]|uniref:Meiotic sister chromatid recombination protein 1 n=1 Tax=Friedmanniomyces endolithicus TaxID=329885 RepID=A0AAN6FDI3_9PEZI|nr:hypothetical protein LTS00_012403 [Friedmanniomyces endolithicus]KAK0289752.1 hypothetical protein LTR35_002950 [Friedmanniomyces endolithicus]KAK0312260.1 hypothetical protein LTR82_014056 [Friedmanniomyces endolithicus]KAK1019831.1 hypothetical protein LTR54_000474 [Friedmanniomyces endolithicus]
MRFHVVAVTALATCAAADIFGSASRTAYNKWHETELERWLSDHNIPFPAASDRKDLQNLVQTNWDNNVAKPYNSWDIHQLTSWMSSQGHEVKKGTEKNKDSLLSQVQGYWQGTSDSANDAYSNVQHWIFDRCDWSQAKILGSLLTVNSWTDSQLKAFLDYHGIPNPQPRTRDSLLSTARSNYQSAANKAGETFSYPGDWLYQSWSDSDLKLWLDERGVPVPQPSSRDKLIATIRRNSKTASDYASSQAASMSKSASSAQQSLSNQLLDSWSDTKLKEFLDKNNINVPQGSKRNELVALARKNYAKLSGDNVASSASSFFGAASTSAGNTFNQATADAYGAFRSYYDYFANQVGFASADAKASMSSASSAMSTAASSSASAASKSASSASKQASKGNYASSASSAAAAATDSAKGGYLSSASSAAKKATDSAKAEL